MRIRILCLATAVLLFVAIMTAPRIIEAANINFNGMAPQSVPNAPSNLIASGQTMDSIQLTWTDNSNNENGFQVERCEGRDCTSFEFIGQLGANHTAVIDTGLPSGTIYQYRVRAFNASGNSAYSNVAMGRTMFRNPAPFPAD
jgi:hypothetical protein